MISWQKQEIQLNMAWERHPAYIAPEEAKCNLAPPT